MHPRQVDAVAQLGQVLLSVGAPVGQALAIADVVAADDQDLRLGAALLELAAAAGTEEDLAPLLSVALPIARLRLEFSTAPAHRFAAFAALPFGDQPAEQVKELGVMFTDLVAASRREEAVLLCVPALALARRDGLSPMERGSILLAAGILQQQCEDAAGARALYEEARQMYEMAQDANHPDAPNFVQQAATRAAALAGAASAGR